MAVTHSETNDPQTQTPKSNEGNFIIIAYRMHETFAGK